MIESGTNIQDASQTLSSTRQQRILFWIGLWVASLLTIISRRPGAVFYPQFWSEDGHIWYADAYNLGGLHALFIPYAGYINIIPRLTAAFSLLFPLGLAPLIFNVVAIIFQILPVIILNSKRFSRVIPNPWARIFLSVIYLAIPNVWEVDANITNAQWHAALTLFLIIIAGARCNRGWKAFDFAMIFLSGLTGPFILVLLPISAVYWWFKRTIESRNNTLIMIFPALVQVYFLFFVGNISRFHGEIGVSVINFARIISGQVIAAGTLGIKGYDLLYIHVWEHFYIPLVVFLVGAALVGFAFVKARLELKLFLVFAGGILVSSLLSPAAITMSPAWKSMAIPDTNLRYFFFPTLAWLTSLFWIAAKGKNRLIRNLAFTWLTVTFLVGVPLSWEDPSLQNLHFQRYARAFYQAPVGTAFAIPTNPPGWKTPMTLYKK